MTESTIPAPPAEGLLARALGILTAPRATYERVVANPRPVGILFLAAVIIALATSIPQFTERGRQALLDMQVQQIEKFTKQPLPDDAYARMEQSSRTHIGAYIGAVGIFIGTPIIALVVAGVYFLVFNVGMGGTAAFKQTLSVVTHSSIITAIGVALGAPIQYMKGSFAATGPFNFGALLPMLDEKSFLANFLSGIDFFRVWSIIVTSIGLSVLYRRKSGNIAIALFIVYGVIVAGFAAFLSR
jgi:hypothetical protein